jgi:hypothetical protein
VEAAVPNCSFNGLRLSGIYEEEEDGDNDEKATNTSSSSSSSAYIVEYAYTEKEEAIAELGEHKYGLVKSGHVVDQVLLTFSDRILARDRDDWKKGRTVSGIDGVRYGKYNVTFTNTVISSGPFLRLEASQYGTDATIDSVDWAQWSSYLLVATVDECPPRPSGSVELDDGLQCLGFIFLECERFAEDVENYPTELSTNETSICEIGSKLLHMLMWRWC